MRKTIFSVLAIGIVAMMVGAGALSIYKDTERSRGNTLTTGSLDLWVGVDDSSASYTQDVIKWGPKQELGDGDLIFDWNDVKPGDSGEATIVLYVDNNDAWLSMKVGSLYNNEMGMTEPEMEVDTTTDTGELADCLHLIIWEDMGGEVPGNNVYDAEERILWNGFAIDLPEVFELEVPGGENYYIGFSWSVDIGVGNEIQGDQVKFDIQFDATQKRNTGGSNVYACEEKLYLSNSGETGTGLYEVVMDDENDRANLFHLEQLNAENFEQVDAIAVTPMGEKLYAFDKISKHLGVYDINADAFTDLGEITLAEGGSMPEHVVLAAFTPDGRLYMMSDSTEKLYEIDITTRTATSHGTIAREDDGQPLDIQGADIAFTPLGRLYIWVNSGTEDRKGSYFVVTDLSDPKARFLGSPDPVSDFSGTALRECGTGNLVGSSRTKDIIYSVHPWDATVAIEYRAYVEDTVELFDLTTGDMAGTLYDP